MGYRHSAQPQVPVYQTAQHLRLQVLMQLNPGDESGANSPAHGLHTTEVRKRAFYKFQAFESPVEGLAKTAFLGVVLLDKCELLTEASQFFSFPPFCGEKYRQQVFCGLFPQPRSGVVGFEAVYVLLASPRPPLPRAQSQSIHQRVSVGYRTTEYPWRAQPQTSAEYPPAVPATEYPCHAQPKSIPIAPSPKYSRDTLISCCSAQLLGIPSHPSGSAWNVQMLCLQSGTALELRGDACSTLLVEAVGDASKPQKRGADVRSG